MGFFKQLRLLLRHKVLLRRRQPAILCLEIFWPAFVFTAVLIIRLQFPPKLKPPCYYNSKSMPTGGAVNFVQSLVCTYDNACINASEYEEIPRFSQSRIHEFVDSVSPLLEATSLTGKIKDIPKAVALMATVVETVSIPEIKTFLENGIRLKDIIRDENIEKMKHFVKNSLLKQKLITNTSKTVEMLVNSSVNVFKLSQMVTQHLDSISDVFCAPHLLQQILVTENRSYFDAVSMLLCTLNKEQQQFINNIQESLDFQKIAKLISNFMERLSLWEIKSDIDYIALMITTTFSPEFREVSTQFSSLYNIRTQLLNNRDSLVPFLNIVRNSSVVRLINEMMEIKNKLPPGVGKGPVLQSVTAIAAGLQSLKRLSDEGLFITAYKFRELIKNTETVRLLMEYHLGIEPLASEAILNSTIDFTQFVAEGNVDEDLLCNRAQMESILTIPKSDKNEELASMDITFHSICTLSIAENYKFTKETLNRLAVKKLLENSANFVVQAVLMKSKLSKADIPQALSTLKVTAKSMPHVKQFFRKLTNSLHLEQELSRLNLRGTAVDLLDSSEAAKIAGKFMCGKPLPVFNKEFKQLKSSQRKQMNRDETEQLPNESCRRGYQQIMQIEGGPLIWTFLKPLLFGKILFTPKTTISEQIINRMNTSFESVSRLQSSLHELTQVIRSLQQFYETVDTKYKIQSVKRLIVQLIGKDIETLFEDEDTLTFLEQFSNTKGILSLIELIANVTQCLQLQRFVGFENEVLLEEAAKKLTKSHELICGIVFLNLEDDGFPTETLPKQVHYKLRFDIDFVPSTKLLKERIWEPGARDNYASDLGYFKGFTQMQELIDRSITLMHINKSELDISPSVYLQQFPYPCYKEDKFGLYVLCLMPVIATIAWIFLIGFLIREFVLERELHLEEVLRVAGLKPTVAWLTWFILGFSVLAFGSLCAVGLLWLSQLLPHSNLILIYCYFMTFSFSLLMYCYLMSSFFKVATIASLSGIVVYLASYLPFMVAITLEYEMTFIHKLFTCLSMSTSFCFGVMYSARYEAQGVGIQWSNIWLSPMTEDTMNFATSAIMMIVDGIIYFLIAWYISNVFPAGNNGHHEPWYFFILPSYWGFKANKNSLRNSIPEHLQPSVFINGKISIENELRSWQKRPGMSLHNLYVIYNKGTKYEQTAVSNLNLELKEGQITTLLGRNGAGKTTTISVLTGQLPPTSGSVFIYGHAVPQQFMEARKLLGYCPQYNVLFDNLTVREHLRFYSDLKGLLPDDQIEEDVDTMLHSTGLWQLQHELAKNISGGLQRRLCVALAFVGGSKLIILDEPTSSVDPVARRDIWDLIVNQKQSRTVLLTTHHLDEADILSDQVAVIHRGKLLCNGSPLLLKSKYGCGYQLTVSKQCIDETNDGDSGRASNEPSEEQSDSDRLLAFTKCLIPNASLIEEYNNEVTLALPPRGVNGSTHDYSTFFRCLDANLRTLGFSHYGLRSTTLEEVFIALCSLEKANIPSEEAKFSVSTKLSNSLKKENFDLPVQPNHTDEGFSITNPPLVSGIALKVLQLSALLSKRKAHAIRDWKSLSCSVLLPCLFMAFAMGMSLIKPSLAPDPILPLTPSIYGRSTASFISAIDQSETINQIERQLWASEAVQQPNCAKPRSGWKVAKCPIIRGAASDLAIFPDHLQRFDLLQEPKCDCQTCDTSSSQTIFEPIKTSDGYVYNLTNADVTPFLLRSFSTFNDIRFGGITFHAYNDSKQNKNVAKVWFENSGFHAVTSYLNTLDNAILKANLNANGLNASKYMITTYSHPFHIRSAQLGDQSLMQRAGDAGIALIILVGFVFIPTSVVFFLVGERTREEKQLQRIFGVGTILYWLSALIWDMLTIVISVALSAVIIIIFQLPLYTARLNLPAVLLLLLCFGWAMTSIVYLMEKLFRESSIAFMVIYCLALFVGMNTMVMRLLIDVFKIVEVSPSFKATFETVALVFPPYALLSGLVDITRNQLFADIFTLFDQDTYVNPFSMQLLGRHYYTLAFEGAFLFVINLIVEYICFSGIKADKKNSSTTYFNEDSDVAEERKRVTQTAGSRFDVLSVINVSKVFKNIFGKKIAIDHISFAVPKGECFGLLGVNGAGKTTLFRILTGQMKPSSGEARINNQSIKHLLSSSYQYLGYCPQADALDFALTPREHLKIYAKMRGIKPLHITTIVIESIRKFQLSLFADIPVNALSRGTKRKLCLAIAMLGNPKIVLLDEPTSGMDPLSRRCLWQNIQSAVRDHCSVILTSHSMEECDILCSRLAIMVNGRFCCIGSPQYLKHKFGTGYTITLRLSERMSNWNEAIHFIKSTFSSCVLRAHHHNMLEFSIPTNNIPLSTIFNNLQAAQSSLHFQDFSVSQTTLDQVFVSFANQQRSELSNTHHSSETQNAVYANKAFVASTAAINECSDTTPIKSLQLTAAQLNGDQCCEGVECSDCSSLQFEQKSRKMKKQLMNIKHFVQDINLTTRGEKNDVLNTDLLNAEKKVELIKHICQSTEKKISACLQSAGTGTDPSSIEKRYKKMPEIQLHLCFQELGEQISGDSVLGQTLVECSEIERLIGQETVNYELNVEKQCLSSLNNLLENDIPSVFKYRKQLNKSTQDRDNLRQRYQTAMKQSTQSSGSAVTFANKAQSLKKDLEESSTKVEQSKDAFAAEVLSFLSRESEFSQFYLQYLKLQSSYYRKVSEILDNAIPNVEELIVNSVQKPCFGTPLEEHLRVTDKEVSIVIETCIGWLLNNLNEEGLFRIPGSTSKVKKLKCSFDAGVIDIDEYARDPHTVAGCLKSYLRELPEPLLTHQFYDEWIDAAKITDSNARLQSLWQISNKLPKSNYANLKYLVKFLAKLTQNSNANKMSSQNIAIAMAPSLIWPPNVESDDSTFGLNMTAANMHSVIVDCLVMYADWFFPGEVEFTTLPIFGALLNGDSEENHNPVPAPRTMPRVSKKPAPPAPPERSSEQGAKQGTVDNDFKTSTLPRSAGKILKPHRPSVNEKSFSLCGDVDQSTTENRMLPSVGSLERSLVRAESVDIDKKSSPVLRQSGSDRANRNSLEKPAVPPPCVPCVSTKYAKTERPSSFIERPSVPPPERPQRLCDTSRGKENDTEGHNNERLYPDLSQVTKETKENSDKLVKQPTNDSIDTNYSSNSDKDSITFVDESEEEMTLEALNRKVKRDSELLQERDHVVDDGDSCSQRSPSKVKPPRPQPPSMKPKPNFNENTYL